MRAIKDFTEYLEEGIVIKKTPDISRSESCLKEARKTEEFIQEVIKTLGINDKNANTVIKLTYDVIMENIRAKLFKEGFSANGKGAHEAEVAYLKVLQFSEEEVSFCDQLRYFRNGILYYGKEFDAQYAKKVISFQKEFNKKIQKR